MERDQVRKVTHTVDEDLKKLSSLITRANMTAQAGSDGGPSEKAITEALAALHEPGALERLLDLQSTPVKEKY